VNTLKSGYFNSRRIFQEVRGTGIKTKRTDVGDIIMFEIV